MPFWAYDLVRLIRLVRSLKNLLAIQHCADNAFIPRDAVRVACKEFTICLSRLDPKLLHGSEFSPCIARHSLDPCLVGCAHITLCISGNRS